MKIYKLEIRAESSLILVSEVGYQGFIYKSVRDEISGLIQRGALFTKAIEERILTLNDAINLALVPRHSLLPALATDRDGSSLLVDLLPAHCLCFCSKSSDRVISLGAHKLKDIPIEDCEEALKRLIREREDLLKPGESRKVGGRPSLKDGNGWKLSVLPKTTHYTEVALDPARGGALPGLLFSYELISKGSLYNSLLALDESNPLNELLKKGSFELNVGRGISRGFGRVSVKAVSIELPQIGGYKHGEQIILEAVSPIFLLDPLPRPPRRGDTIRLDPSWYLRIYNKEYEVKLKVERVLGSVTIYKGWSMKTNRPRAPIRALNKGSLLICKILDGSIDHELASLLPILGINEASSMGFNHLLPLDMDPFWVS